MRRSRRSLFLIGAAVAIGLTASGCSAASTSSIQLGAATVVVDVRTSGEYAGGHLDGAVNIDLESATFASAVSQLDPAADYVVYCQSGNRSAQAAQVMDAAGLDVQDAGGISQAAQATGLSIVR
ncbi:rhodanese-like domain-containing protein [Microbacterium sp.]|uniref:rhodanese-like domain-containing protein n=1 Tax=Microbacterium sp. TaxID=51671 RepID=UPI0025FD0E7D|nr:rhodanese-like domain-containing protein [Microbacterium sp.]